jgi:hypothetical protein
MFCAPGLVFGDTKAFVTRFHVLRARTRYRLYRGGRVPLSSFARPDSFSAVPRASVPIFTFCPPRLIFDGTESVGSRFHILRARTHFRRYRGRPVLFSSFERPDSFSAVPRASGPVIMFCAPELVFGGTSGVVSRFYVLRTLTYFRRYRGRRLPFSRFALPDAFSAVPRASCSVFMFCAPGLIFGGTEGVVSRFHVLRARTHFRRYGGSRVPFSCFACPDSFWLYRGRRVPFFMFCARTRFLRYRGRHVPFSRFACPDSFLAVPRASCSVFMFCAPEVIFGGTEGVGSRFHVLRAQTRFRTEGVVSRFHVLLALPRFRRYRGRPRPF